MHLIVVQCRNFKCHTIAVAHIVDTQLVVRAIYQVKSLTYILQANTRLRLTALLIDRILEAAYNKAILALYINIYIGGGVVTHSVLKSIFDKDNKNQR